MAKSKGVKGLKGSDFVVSTSDHPDWPRASECPPDAGATVFCAGGEGVLVSLHGKTGDGSRLLEIRLSDEKAPPYFAAASNVLVKPAPVASRRERRTARVPLP